MKYRDWWFNRFTVGLHHATGHQMTPRIVPGDSVEWVDYIPLDTCTHDGEIIAVGVPIPGLRVPIMREPNPQVTSICAVAVRNEFTEYVRMHDGFCQQWPSEVLGVPVSCYVDVADGRGWDIAAARNRALRNAPETSHVLVCDIDTRLSPAGIASLVGGVVGHGKHPMKAIECRHEAGDEHRRYAIWPRALALSMLFDEGFKGIFSEDTELFMRLASRGYVLDMIRLQEQDFYAQAHPKLHRTEYAGSFQKNHDLIQLKFIKMKRDAEMAAAARREHVPA